MINRQEVSKLLAHLTPRNNDDIKAIQKYVCISTLVFLGLRMSELRALRWHNIDFDLQKLSIKTNQFIKHTKYLSHYFHMLLYLPR